MISKKELLSSEYSVEVLTYMLDLERQLPRLGDYIKNNPQIEIESWMIDKLVLWMVNTGERMGMSIEAMQLSITIINQFFSAVETKRSVLQLAGMVSLIISMKFHDSKSLPLEAAVLHCGEIYSKDDFQSTEIYFLQRLEWCLKIPTASELSRQLLYISGVNYDFSKIIERGNSFAMTCYCDYSLSQFSPLVISIVSIVCALEQFNQKKFRDQWLKLLKHKVGLDAPVLDHCKRALIHKLYRESPEKSAEILSALRESLLQILENL